jgi:patatin-like phospholipase
MSDSALIPIGQVLDDEYRYLHGEQGSNAGGRGLEGTLRRHERAGHAALCLSGGGVRSASFGLGVLQGLARAGILDRFDYLSTVSGGGYIGGWWSAWRHRAALRNEREPGAQLAEALAGEPAPEPLTRLRLLVKFLTPRAGVLSPDVWTLAGTMVRNLLVNWLVLIPLVAAAALVPQLYLGVLGLPSQPELVRRATLDWWYLHDWIPIVLLIAVAATYAALELPSLGHRSDGSGSFLAWFLTPVLLIHFLLSVHRYWAWRFGDESPIGSEWVISAAAMVVPWVIGGAFGRRWWRPWTWLAAATAGAIGRIVISSAHHALTLLARDVPHVFVVVELPVSLALLLLQFTAFVGLASRDMDDDDREWWARAGAWLLIVAATWLVVSAVVILGPFALDAIVARLGISTGAARTALGILTLFSGGAAYKSNALGRGSPITKQLEALAFMMVAPVIVVLIMVLVADGNRVLLSTVHDLNLFDERKHPIGASLPEDFLVLGVLLFVGLALGRIMSMNPFSLHAMYRARLVRTFLGVSRPQRERHPSAFTGFDPDDDIKMAQLSGDGRPLHVVNATLNLVAENRLATVVRKGASFTLSAMHVGSRDVGYRPSLGYAGGVSLGEALTTSGAAVSPNMGAASTPALTFLLTVFNARLGVWFGNPGAPGDATWTHPAPTFGVGALLSELVGRTSDRSPYVYLSDGGHFENLGLYEMVFRRCRFIVVSDAGGDPSYTFGDLANAIRRVRLDFGIDVEFPDGVRIGSRPVASLSRCAVGTIRYSAVDPEAEDGVLVYLKPTLVGDEPVDVANYARAHPAFPQESTAEQWFDEAQFESYRMLGLHTVMSLAGSRRFESVRDFCLAAGGKQIVPVESNFAAFPSQVDSTVS